MPIIETRCLIRAEQARAFHAAQDYAERAAWDPFFGGLWRDPQDGLVTVRAWHGLRMCVEYLVSRPPDRAAMRMVQGPKCLASFAGSWAFLPRDGDTIEARFRYQLKAAKGWRWLEPLMLAYFRWETKRRLSALKNYLEGNPQRQP